MLTKLQALELKELLDRLASILKGDVSREQIANTIIFLENHNFDDLKNAIMEGSVDWTFFPTPGEIVKLIRKPDNNGEEWWNRLLDSAQKRGFNAGPPTDLPEAARRAMENIGGYYAICFTDSDKLTILASQFRGAFKTFAEAEARNENRALTQAESQNFLNRVNAAQIGEMPKKGVE